MVIMEMSSLPGDLAFRTPVCLWICICVNVHDGPYSPVGMSPVHWDKMEPVNSWWTICSTTLQMGFFFFLPIIMTILLQLVLARSVTLQHLYFQLSCRYPLFYLHIRILWLRHLSHQEPQDYRLLQQSHNAPTTIRDLVKADLTLKREKVADWFFSTEPPRLSS